MDNRKKVYFLTYANHQKRFFEILKNALPSNIYGVMKSVYTIAPWTLLNSKTKPDGLTEADVDKIIELTYIRRGRKLNKQSARKLHAKLRHRAIQWYRLFLRELRDFDVLVIWNGFAVTTGAASAAARSLGKQVLFCENGVLPGTVAMDTKGVNFNNSLTGKGAEYYRSVPIKDADISKLYNTIWPQRPLRKSQSANDNLDESKPLPERYLFYAMQVHDDSQIQLFSPRFRSMVESVTYVYEQMQKYNKSVNDSLCLVVKEHPSDYGRIDYTELRESLPDVTFLRLTPIRDLIEKAQAVVTINSSVAVEAMFSSHPIITLGQAFFNIPGLVYHIDGQTELAECLPSILSEPVDKELRQHYLSFLWTQYLVPRPNNDSENTQRGVQRIVDVLKNALPY